MAHILIFQGSIGPFLPLQNSLQDDHDLYFVHSMTEALKLLHEREIELIITNAHDDETTDNFSFMQRVRKDAAFTDIPIVCLSTERSSIATHLDAIVGKSALLCGADKYLTMDSFCLAKKFTAGCLTCPLRNELCDFAGLKRAVEAMIPERESSAKNVHFNYTALVGD